MIKSINLGEKTETIKALEALSEDDKTVRDIHIVNSHILDINNLVGKKIFKKDALYISSKTIFDIMQPMGGKDQHNYHELTPEDVFMALSSIKDPKCVFITGDNRYALISIELSHFDLPLMLVIETEASLIEKWDASINKVVTIYPRSSVDKYIEKIDERKLLYLK